MNIVGYILAVLIGLTLGLIGGGGSILCVPILVYFMGIPAVQATGYSLFIVGGAALYGAIKKWRLQEIDLRTGIYFAIPSIVAVYLTRRFLIPMIPDPIYQSSAWIIDKDEFVLLLFSLIMILAAISMIRSGKKRTNSPKQDSQSKQSQNRPLFKIILEGSVVGVITGMVGAGGGFLIVPALVLMGGLEMKMAVGTSLFIIASKSLIGFIGEYQVASEIDWTLLCLFTFLALLGILIGNHLSRLVKGQQLKSLFGYFVLAMAIVIVVFELF